MTRRTFTREEVLALGVSEDALRRLEADASAGSLTPRSVEALKAMAGYPVPSSDDAAKAEHALQKLGHEAYMGYSAGWWNVYTDASADDVMRVLASITKPSSTGADSNV